LIEAINMVGKMVSWLSQEEACQRLGIKRDTLYAYVSRGRVTAMPDATHQGRSVYRAADVDALVSNRTRGRKRQAIAASTMSWGEPSITTQISTISGNRLYYRGKDAVAYAASASFEAAAKLLWQADHLPGFSGMVPEGLDLPTRSLAHVALALVAGEGAPTVGLAASVLQRESARIVGQLTAAFVGNMPDVSAPLHERIGRIWCLDATGTDLIRRALVLLADQELTSSAFAARVAASTGASLGACAAAGLATVSGPLHGDATRRVYALIEEVNERGAERALRRRLDSGLPVPGFGHPLYPEGDPRAADLLQSFEPPAPIVALIVAAEKITGNKPTIDVALAALVDHCRLPTDTAFALFAIGRSVGWMAHAMEQITQATLLRPRARYTGPALEI
jgi:citrate synthase